MARRLERQLTRCVTAIMNGAKRNGVSCGVLRPCKTRVSSTQVAYVRAPTHNDTESDQNKGPGCVRCFKVISVTAGDAEAAKYDSLMSASRWAK